MGPLSPEPPRRADGRTPTGVYNGIQRMPTPCRMPEPRTCSSPKTSARLLTGPQGTPAPRISSTHSSTALLPNSSWRTLTSWARLARVEDEQRIDVVLGQPAQQSADLLGCHEVGVLLRAHALHVGRGDPTVTVEAELGDELVGPAGDDGLACRVSARMVIVAAFGAALRVVAGPSAAVHRVDTGSVRSARERIADEQLAYYIPVDEPFAERGVGAGSAPTPRRCTAQVDRRGCGTGREDGVGQLEEGICPSRHARVQAVAEGQQVRRDVRVVPHARPRMGSRLVLVSKSSQAAPKSQPPNTSLAQCSPTYTRE